jgi:pimeloyl-ACP methyl ester carboxylesterase
MPTASVDGLDIVYEDAGIEASGEALVCMTGWCSSARRFDVLVPLLRQAGQRVITFDWRGHGRSDAPATDFGLAEQVADALAVVRAAGVADRFIPVCASHSGWVGIELARRLGAGVPAIVLMDWMVLQPPASYVALTADVAGYDTWRSARDALVERWRAGTSDERIESVLTVLRDADGAMWRRSGREITDAYARWGSPLAALTELGSPPRVLHLYGQPRDETYRAGQERFAAAVTWFTVQHVSAQTHFSMIESAAEVASAIDTFLNDHPEHA